MKSSCRFKDEKRTTCGKVGHLKSVCRAARGTHQVAEDEKSDAGSIQSVWAMAVIQTNLDETDYQVALTPNGGSEGFRNYKCSAYECDEQSCEV